MIPLALVALLLVLLFGVGSCVSNCAGGHGGKEDQADQQVAADPNAQRVHFVAVGDNLPNGNIGEYADAQEGAAGDGTYDYSSLYVPIKETIEMADLAYVDQETVIGGSAYGPQGYPSFNTTDEMADAIVNAGFDLVASATNHSYDYGQDAIDHSTALWKTKDVAFTGTASNAEDAAKIPVVERNGITFALLNYTYGVNAYEPDQLPDYAVNFASEERITADVAKAKEAADVVLVAMHWGTEKQMSADESQLQYAQLLADLGVDVVLGSHPHVIGPMDMLTGKNGNQTLVAYSLGNFVSDHENSNPNTALEGMLSCDFVKGADGAVTIEGITWTPMVNHRTSTAVDAADVQVDVQDAGGDDASAEAGQWTDTDYAVYFVRDYTPEQAAQDRDFNGIDDPIAWLRQTSRDVVGEHDWLTFNDGSDQ